MRGVDPKTMSVDDPVTSESDAAGRPRYGFLLHVAPALLYVAAIFYAGTVGPAVAIHVGDLPWDKLEHFIAFGFMAVLLYRALRWQLPHISRGRQLLIAAVLASAAGALLELVQATLPHRSAELLDWIADMLGAGLAGLLLFKVKAAETEN